MGAFAALIYPTTLSVMADTFPTVPTKRGQPASAGWRP